MDYRKISVETWGTLDNSGDLVSGYSGVWLSLNDNQLSSLHIFKDENGYNHFAIEVNKADQKYLEDPRVNGLHLSLSKYRLDKDSIKLVIDLRCNLFNYTEEFTGVVRDIAKSILEDSGEPFEVVNRVIRNWRVFWSIQNKQILSEEQQIGLICELKILQRLGSINPFHALNSWTGPLGQKHDFNFSGWNIEVKGTRRENHIHTINGIDQLKSVEGKELAFVSILVTTSNNINSLSLPDTIDETILITFGKHPDLVIKFLGLLAKAGYNPIAISDYREFKIELLESYLFIVNKSFPSLTTDDLTAPLNNRINNVRYEISLEGINGFSLQELNWGNYFY